MRGRSNSGQSRKVAEARKKARQALDRDDTPGLFDGQANANRYVEAQPAPELGPSEAIGVLTLGEAAARLGLSRPELEAMIAAGKIEAQETGFTRTIPTSEVARLLKK